MSKCKNDHKCNTKSKLIADEKEKTYAIIFDAGNEVMKGLLDFAEQKDLSAGSFKAIGA